MSDKYTRLVSHGLGKDLAKRLGLPQPVVLRRHEPGNTVGGEVEIGRASSRERV